MWSHKDGRDLGLGRLDQVCVQEGTLTMSPGFREQEQVGLRRARWWGAKGSGSDCEQGTVEGGAHLCEGLNPRSLLGSMAPWKSGQF